MESEAGNAFGTIEEFVDGYPEIERIVRRLAAHDLRPIAPHFDGQKRRESGWADAECKRVVVDFGLKAAIGAVVGRRPGTDSRDARAGEDKVGLAPGAGIARRPVFVGEPNYRQALGASEAGAGPYLCKCGGLNAEDEILDGLDLWREGKPVRPAATAGAVRAW